MQDVCLHVFQHCPKTCMYVNAIFMAIYGIIRDLQHGTEQQITLTSTRSHDLHGRGVWPCSCLSLIFLTTAELSPHRPFCRQSTSSCHEGVTFSCLSHKPTILVRQSLGVEPEVSLTTVGSIFRARPRACHWSFSSAMVPTTSKREDSPVRGPLLSYCLLAN